ncbi:thiosulfate sulfurtransferase domain protein [Mycobacterium kansasii]|uniref:Thiosulfate sulfurtransferase domain protein n=1 Tax=Mycobacterium kansasii TaxID=1768 RepID=A0A1V3WXW0_MYCKA|nr:thiosulfate sulfurtransferase domain protein [Mycobacterium kansasii]
MLITVAELASRIRSAEPVTLLDVRWRLDEPDGHSAYLRSHLPGRSTSRWKTNSATTPS